MLSDSLGSNYLSMNKQRLMGVIIKPMISWQDKKENLESMEYLAVTKIRKKKGLCRDKISQKKGTKNKEIGKKRVRPMK